jgi:hypothetical protein
MKPIRIAGLCLAAVFAMSAVVSGSAFAAPERGACKKAKKGDGIYLNSTCTQPGAAGGANKEFVWLPQATGTPNGYSAKGLTATLRAYTPEGAALPVVACTSSKTKGKEGRTESTSIIKFKGCESEHIKCASPPPAVAGEIITFELKGELGVIDTATEEVGEDFVGTGRGEDRVAEFECGRNIFETRGSVIAVITPINAKASTKSTRTYRVVGAKQEPESFEGEAKDTLESEIDGLGGREFPLPSTEETVEEVTSKPYETRF